MACVFLSGLTQKSDPARLAIRNSVAKSQLKTKKKMNSGQMIAYCMAFVTQFETPFHAKKTPTNMATINPINTTLIVINI
mmetsp:Transcript_29587/g.54192  ORF Transcript_29587/g.54192 Transcript_29587/m.54192 type:complete len:80 (-) Transcript_29587:1219-1458(-)